MIQPIHKPAWLALFLLTGMFNFSCGQTRIDKLDELIGAYAEYGQFNGSVLVAEKGKIIYSKGFGMANFEWNIPNQADTKHRLGSITKQFTAMLIMQLVEQNKLALDAPITTYLPDYPSRNGDAITPHHLLTHTSGIPNYTDFPGFREMMPEHYLPGEMVSLFADSALQFKPGERFEYSNSGYILLGVIIEKVTGKSYEQVLQENILTPLGMNDTGYDHYDILLENRASGYNRNGRNYANATFIDMSIPYAAGALYSTVEDLYLWDQALYTSRLLRKENMDIVFAHHIDAGGGYYGYGWFMGGMNIGNTQEQVQTISHGGSVNGFSSLIMRVPSDQSLIVLLNNTGGAPLEDLAAAILGIIHDKPYDFPKKSVAYSVSDVMETEGVAVALLHYSEVKDSAGYFLSEQEMNGAGYQLLNSGKAKEAATLFELNVEAFPKSFNVYDSYGEALLVLGDTTLAIENYKHSVKLNPASEGGIKVLKDLGVNADDFIIKVSADQLKVLEGEYLAKDDPGWMIKFEVVNGILYGNDRGYRYKVIPVGDHGEFMNPDDGASLVFDTKDRNAITLVLFEKVEFRKVK